MRKILSILFIYISLWAADYSAMSVQELLAIMNYTIDQKDQALILKELKSRVSEMSKQEKDLYKHNLKLLKSGNGKK